MKNLEPAYQPKKRVGALKSELIEQLAYFGVFNHPLRAEEIQNLLHNYYSLAHIKHALNEVVAP